MSLRHGIAQYSNNCRGGAEKTRFNHVQEASKFCERLHGAGYHPQKWSNVTNKHIAAVVDKMKEEGKATSTIKETLSGVRAVAAYFNNDKISDSNKDFGIENRVYVTNDDKSGSDSYLASVVSSLEERDNDRLCAQLCLCRELGLRIEEAIKFDAKTDVLNNGENAYISRGTKGGRERMLTLTTGQKEAIDRVAQYCTGTGSIPADKSEKQYSSFIYREAREAGLTKENGGSFHSFRHAFAHEYYQNYTGFECRAKFETQEEFEKNAKKTRSDYKEVDREARHLLKSILGHGPDRGDVVSQYVGSSVR